MSYGTYLRNCLAEYALCALMALGLGLNLVQGFHIPDATAENVLIVAACTAAPLVPLFLAGYSKKSLAIGIPLMAIGVIACLAALSRLTPTPLFAETYENTALVFVVLLPLAVAVYFLARTRTGTVVCFVAGCILCGTIQFLYGKDLVGPTILFVVSCAALYLAKSSRILLGQDVEKQPSEGTGEGVGKLNASSRKRLPLLTMSVGLTSLAALLAAGVFFAIIAPLNPPAHELKLITEYYSLEEVHVSGILAFLHQRNDDYTSANQDNQTRNSNQTGDDAQNADGTSDAQTDGADPQQGEGSYDALTIGDPLSIVRYFQEHWWVGVIVLVTLLLTWALVVLARRLARRRRLRRWQALGPRGEYLGVFDHICSTLEQAGILTRGSKTPLELATSSAEQIRNLESKQSAGDSLPGFAHLAESFARISYGNYDPTADELSAVESYSELLPRRLARTIGRFKYTRHFFHV